MHDAREKAIRDRKRDFARLTWLVVIITVLCGCSKATIEFRGFEGPIDFHGLKVNLPNNSKGAFAITPNDMEWRHDTLVILIKDVGEEGFEIRSNGSLVGKARKGDQIWISDDGKLIPKKE